jgi:hypothetical protein
MVTNTPTLEPSGTPTIAPSSTPQSLICPDWDWENNPAIYMHAGGQEGDSFLKNEVQLINLDTDEHFLLDLSGTKRGAGYFWHPSQNAIGYIVISGSRTMMYLIDLDTCLKSETQLSDFEHEIISTVLLYNLGVYSFSSSSPMIPLYAFHPNGDTSKIFFVREDEGIDESTWVSPDGQYLILNAGYWNKSTEWYPTSLQIVDLVSEDDFEIEIPEMMSHNRLTWLVNWFFGGEILAVDNYLYDFNSGEGMTLPEEIFPPYDWLTGTDQLLYHSSYPPSWLAFYDNTTPLEYATYVYDYSSSPCSYNLNTQESLCYQDIRKYHDRIHGGFDVAFYLLEWLNGGTQIGYSYFLYDEDARRGGGYCIYTIEESAINCITDDLPGTVSSDYDAAVMTPDILHSNWTDDEVYVALFGGDSCPQCEFAFDRRIYLKDADGNTLYESEFVSCQGLWRPIQ